MGADDGGRHAASRLFGPIRVTPLARLDGQLTHTLSVGLEDPPATPTPLTEGQVDPEEKPKR